MYTLNIIDKALENTVIRNIEEQVSYTNFSVFFDSKASVDTVTNKEADAKSSINYYPGEFLKINLTNIGITLLTPFILNTGSEGANFIMVAYLDTIKDIKSKVQYSGVRGQRRIVYRFPPFANKHFQNKTLNIVTGDGVNTHSLTIAHSNILSVGVLRSIPNSIKVEATTYLKILFTPYVSGMDSQPINKINALKPKITDVKNFTFGFKSKGIGMYFGVNNTRVNRVTSPVDSATIPNTGLYSCTCSGNACTGGLHKYFEKPSFELKKLEKQGEDTVGHNGDLPNNTLYIDSNISNGAYLSSIEFYLYPMVLPLARLSGKDRKYIPFANTNTKYNTVYDVDFNVSNANAASCVATAWVIPQQLEGVSFNPFYLWVNNLQAQASFILESFLTNICVNTTTITEEAILKHQTLLQDSVKTILQKVKQEFETKVSIVDLADTLDESDHYIAKTYFNLLVPRTILAHIEGYNTPLIGYSAIGGAYAEGFHKYGKQLLDLVPYKDEILEIVKLGVTHIKGFVKEEFVTPELLTWIGNTETDASEDMPEYLYNAGGVILYDILTSRYLLLMRLISKLSSGRLVGASERHVALKVKSCEVLTTAITSNYSSYPGSNVTVVSKNLVRELIGKERQEAIIQEQEVAGSELEIDGSKLEMDGSELELVSEELWTGLQKNTNLFLPEEIKVMDKAYDLIVADNEELANLFEAASYKQWGLAFAGSKLN